ncbi:polyprenol monophosphomannose synthase [Cellulomonas aerilata]|uniref:Dolichol-phosphate mannosyltransferase n=1 Tax=Cellulomonas aerilata TaxID=515326 RepID=A0A512DAE2_9CELL|nr:polyprenol monophosphomannose synthase [Cellulomonas aerilata]GEO33452.1 dolichol-phosphate mannosyltransferase [Cellulomonas aerilata]
MTRTLVVIPTYDEATTLPRTLRALRDAVPSADVLVVDDASPDGTGDVADAWAARDGSVHVLHRTGKLGLGTAYVAGFGWALERGYDVVVEMDADGSHRAVDLPAILAALDGGVGLVLGSRWVPGGRVVHWPRHRQWLSRGGNTYARRALGLPLRDATGGFRAYRAGALRDVHLEDVASQGYCFQVDMARRVVAAGHPVVEVPITFVERVDGRSKMTRGIVAEALLRVTVWGVTRRMQQTAGALRRLSAMRVRQGRLPRVGRRP